jgi:hypothetical protein
MSLAYHENLVRVDLVNTKVDTIDQRCSKQNKRSSLAPLYSISK